MTTPKPDRKPRALRVPEVAERLGCSVRHAYQLIADRLIPTVDIGIGRSKTRVMEDDLDAYIEANRTPAKKKRRTA